MSADTLWASGHRAEAFGEAHCGFSMLLNPDLVSGLSPRDARIVRAASRVAPFARSGSDDLVPADGEAFVLLQGATRVLESRSARSNDTSSAKRRTRLLRAVDGSLRVGLLLVGVAVVWTRLSPSVEFEASAYREVHGETWPPENVFDRDEMTYWHLAPNTPGWIELRFPSPRSVRGLRILNAHDLHANDHNRYRPLPYNHAARAISVEVYSGTTGVARVDHELSRVQDFERETILLPSREVDRIRIEIRSWYEAGGGLAEVEVLP